MASDKIIERKKQEVQELEKIFSQSGVYLFDYRGMSVSKMTEFREKVKALDANVKVIKNRLAVKYFEREKKDYGRDIFNGPTAVAYGTERFVEVAKLMVDSEKDYQHIKLKAGFIEGNFADEEKVRQVAKLPSREQLMSQLAFSVVMPLKKFGMSLSAPLKNFLILMNNLKDKKEKEEK